MNIALGKAQQPKITMRKRKKSIRQILREAYRAHCRDKTTRIAVKRCLGCR